MRKREEPVEKIKTSLEIDERLELHKQGWVAQRFGLAFIYLLVLAAAIGVFGNGFVSKVKTSRVRSAIEYERFYRQEAPMEFHFKIRSNSSSAIISMPVNYVSSFEVKSILPATSSVKTEGDFIHYEFPGKGNMHIVFYLTPQKVGSHSAQIRVNDESFDIQQFIYP